MPNISGLPTTYNTFLNSNDATAGERLGTYRFVDERGFMYVHAEEALVCGNTAQTFGEELANADVDGWDATTQTLTGTGDFSGLVVTGGYIYLDVTPGIGSMAKIDGSTANTVHLQNMLDSGKTGNNVLEPDGTAPTTSSDFIVFSGVDARKADAGEEVLVGGVAQSALTADYYGWLQVYGPGLGLLDTSEGQPSLGLGVVNGGAVAGTVEAVATGTAAEIPYVFGYFLVDLTSDDTVPINITIR